MYPSQATWEIFQLTLDSEQAASVSCIHSGKAETAQKSCSHHASPTMFYTCQFRVTICKLSLHVTINFIESITELFAYAQTMCTRHSHWFFEHLGMRLAMHVLPRGIDTNKQSSHKWWTLYITHGQVSGCGQRYAHNANSKTQDLTLHACMCLEFLSPIMPKLHVASGYLSPQLHVFELVHSYYKPQEVDQNVISLGVP